MYLSSLRTLAFKPEASAYSTPQADLLQADLKQKAYNIKYSTNVAEAKRALSVGDMSKFASIMGSQDASVSFSIDLAWGGTVSTAPDWGIVLQSCGFKQTAYTTTGIGWTPNAQYTNVPAVIEILELQEGATTPSQLAIQIRAAMGNVKFVLDSVGKPVRMDFDFKGALQAIEDRATALYPASYQTTVPEAVLGATITAFAEALDLDKVTLDAGAKVDLFVDPAKGEGYSGAHITDRDPKLTIDPYLASIATRSHWARLKGGTTGAFSMMIGTHFTLSAPAIQIVKAYGGDDRNGAVVNSLDCNLTRSSGNDEFELLQGAKA